MTPRSLNRILKDPSDRDVLELIAQPSIDAVDVLQHTRVSLALIDYVRENIIRDTKFENLGATRQSLVVYNMA